MKVSQLHFIGMGLVSVLSFIGCTRNSVVAEVGSYKITKKEVSLRMKAMSVFSPQQNEKMSLEQLIRSYTLAEVMKNRGVKSFDASVEEEAKRIAETSKSNPKIAEVKKTFGRDEEAFMKLFVLPMMADRLAYLDGYLKDEGFHKKQKEKANSFLADAQKNPAAFEELAKKNNFVFKKGTLDGNKGLVWDADRNVASGSLPGGPFVAEQWKKAVLDSTASGKVASSLIEQGNFWVAVKNMGAGKTKGAMDIAAVAIYREPFGAWLEQNKGAVMVKRLDEQNPNASSSTPQKN